MMSYSLPHVSGIRCARANMVTVDSIAKPCENVGSLTCTRCRLVKYCSKQCQTDHWPKHRKDCKHPYLKPDWQPAWVTENRAPTFIVGGGDEQVPLSPAFGTAAIYLWGNVSAVDCLRVTENEGPDSLTRNFKLCFAASGDIRNMVRTVNGLPEDYRGKCNILFNDRNPVVANRNLVILFALLSDGLALVEAAQLATNLMYSSSLPLSSATHLRQCVNAIYRQREWQGQKFPEGCLNTRGKGKIYMLSDMQEPLDMFLSTYTLPAALQSMKSIMLHPSRVDYRDRHLVTLRPVHRLAFMRFRESGILAPFSADLSQHTEPNRLLFSASGNWIAMDSADPLEGWDIAAVCKTGKRYGVDPGDIYGCLFFHVSEELQEFARRMRDWNINIHFTIFDARDLSRTISTRFLGTEFTPGCFDRIETSNLADYVGIKRMLADWAPLLNRGNKHAALLMNFMNWPTKEPDGMAMNITDRKVLRRLTQRVSGAMNIDLRQPLSQSLSSPSYIRVMSGLDSFYDNEVAFQKYLRNEDSDGAAEAVGLRHRLTNRIHTKRFGIDLKDQGQRVPSMSNSEYYDIVTIGRSPMTMRFVEFELI